MKNKTEIRNIIEWLNEVVIEKTVFASSDYDKMAEGFIATYSQFEARFKNLVLADISSSWLDYHILNEDSEIDGVIIKHHYAGVAIKTNIGNFAIVKEDQKKAAKNKGETVRVKPHKDYYGTVMIVGYNDR